MCKREFPAVDFAESVFGLDEDRSRRGCSKRAVVCDNEIVRYIEGIQRINDDTLTLFFADAYDLADCMSHHPFREFPFRGLFCGSDGDNPVGESSVDPVGNLDLTDDRTFSITPLPFFHDRGTSERTDQKYDVFRHLFACRANFNGAWVTDISVAIAETS